ncbi:AgrD family cyclic lactone autoinducer peptide [Bdellovibrio bacteriovorus]
MNKPVAVAAANKTSFFIMYSPKI